jgi:very-short-patch-repair endonuclease
MRTTKFRANTLSTRAMQMRHAPTTSEARLFEWVRGKRLGAAFRRQVPVLGRYIVDLLAPELRLVVEIDGAYHLERGEADARRNRALVRAGYTVVRVDAEVVVRDPEAALVAIREIIARLRGRTG